MKQPTRRPLRGRQYHGSRYGEAAVMLPGCVPTACVQRMVCEQGRARGGKRGLQGWTSGQSEEDLRTHGQSDWLRVLGDGESPLQGDAASR